MTVLRYHGQLYKLRFYRSYCQGPITSQFGRITLTQNRFSRRKRKDLNLLLMMRQI